MNLRAALGIYRQHLITDWSRQVGVRHFLADLGRVLSVICSNSSTAVSYPPHSLKLYQELLEELRDHPQCTFRTLEDHVRGVLSDPQAVNIVLRHDLDAGNDEVAYALCEVEHMLGIRSSVHVLVDGKLYDPKQLIPLARDLHEKGFDVGLHTQAWMHKDYTKVFHREIKKFENLFGFSSQTFSQHGAWPRTNKDMKRRSQFTRDIPELIRGTSIIGYNNKFDWVSQDSAIKGQPAPIRKNFFRLAKGCYLGGVALVLTHDNWWRVI